VFRVAAIVAAGALIALIAYVGVFRAKQARPAARVPSLPELSGQPPALRAHLTEADRAARANPDSPEILGALGLAYHADMLYDEAERSYEIAEELSGSAWTWTYYRALVREARGDSRGLEVGLRRVVAAAPGFSPAWWRLGEVEFKAARYESAEDAWRHVLSLPEPARPAATPGSPARVASAPISAYAALGLARLAMAKGDANGARELLERVTAHAPRFGPAFRLLGSAYAALGRTEDSETATRIANHSPGYDPYVDPMLDALVQQSRSSTFLLQQAAAADLSINGAWREYLVRRALEFDPENIDALYELTSILRAFRRWAEALELLERHRRLTPGNFRVVADIGRCLAGLQRYGEAESVLRRALDGLDDADTRYDLALVLNRTGRFAEAIAEYRRALDRHPNHAGALNNLGVALAQQGRLEEATRQFERLVAIDPENADAHTNLGAMLLAQGARDRAAGEFRAALQLNPNHALAREGLQKVEGR
jgi:tetratricopeptide (TPR) repeat protein